MEELDLFGVTVWLVASMIPCAACVVVWLLIRK